MMTDFGLVLKDDKEMVLGRGLVIASVLVPANCNEILPESCYKLPEPFYEDQAFCSAEEKGYGPVGFLRVCCCFLL
jgi:hypothetical protein